MSAVSACLKAVEAGRPLSEMAPFLADIYGLPLEEITKVPPSLPENNSKETEAQAPSVDATALSSGTVGQ